MTVSYLTYNHDPGRTVQAPFGVLIRPGKASYEHNSGISYKLLKMRYRTYKEIADAFRRLEAGTYGICEHCGSDIPVDRLKVEPFARYCVPCLTQIEALEDVEKEEGAPPSF